MKRIVISTLFIAAFLNLVVAQAADQFFNCNNTAWNTANWAASCPGTLGSSSFTAANVANFCVASGTGTGAGSIQVGGIVVTENYTHSTGSGTMTTGGGVVTVNVAATKTFSMLGISISGAAGTGIIKAGSGTWINSSGANPGIPAGVRFDAGTIGMGGNLCFGTAKLTINADNVVISVNGSGRSPPWRLTNLAI